MEAWRCARNPDLNRYENPWRPNYEAIAVGLWLTVAAISWTTADRWDLHAAPFRYLALAASVMILLRLPGMLRVWRRHHRLHGRPLAFIDSSNLERQVGCGPALWLGWGFDWTGAHAQFVHDLLRVGPARLIGKTPARLGADWIHGVGERERSIRLPLAHTEARLLVVGTTGAGKTRLFDLLVTQAVLRGEAVVIIDPKGDQDLRNAAERACRSVNAPERFVHFHPAFPRVSGCHCGNNSREKAIPCSI